MPPLAAITTGPAAAPIDGVRRIANHATGAIGALLAAELAAQGFEVALFRGTGATRTDWPANTADFTSNEDLENLLAALAASRGADVRAVFHAAALSDYRVADVRGPDGEEIPREGKISGDLPRLHLVLEPAAKLLPRLAAWFPHAWITGWKYELDGSRNDAIEAARGQIRLGHTRATIVNGAAYGPGFGLLEDQNPPLHIATKPELAQILASRAAALAKSHE